MEDVLWYEEFKILIALWSEAADLSCCILEAYIILNNCGSHGKGHHFVSDCEVTLLSIFEFSQV